MMKFPVVLLSFISNLKASKADETQLIFYGCYAKLENLVFLYTKLCNMLYL